MTWSLTHAKLHIQLRKHVLLPPHSRILMAVSGGQDSLCLAKLLIDLQPKWHWSLGIVHCNHCWRDDAAENAKHVLDLATAWNIPAWIKVATSPPKGEAAARLWRYQVFAEVAREQDYNLVVTGHTLSDRAETILYNLLRGTGLDGISTLPLHRAIDNSQPLVTLIRPLLSLTREQTGQFCQTQQLPVWEDSTNQALSFRRNRIRQELLPYIKVHFNPRVEQALAQMGDITTADRHYLEEQTHQLFELVIVKKKMTPKNVVPKSIDTETQSKKSTHKPSWEINRQRLKEAPLALQRRVIKKLLNLALPQPPSFQAIEKMRALIGAPNGSRTDTYPGGLVAQVRWPSELVGQTLSSPDHHSDKSSLVIWLGPIEKK